MAGRKPSHDLGNGGRREFSRFGSQPYHVLQHSTLGRTFGRPVGWNSEANDTRSAQSTGSVVYPRERNRWLTNGLAIKKFYWCLCVNANLYINNLLPPIELFRKNKLPIVLGTDSLASNDSLSILDEIKSIRRAFPSIPQQELLTWASSNGAEALIIDNDYGTFEAGKTPGLIQITLENGEISDGSIVKRIA